MHLRPLLVLAALVLAPFTLAPASASAPLVADAGDSAVAYNDEPLALRGSARGGAAPYAFLWTWTGDPTRLGDADAANASFDPAGLPPQDLVFTLTVTDADGAVATDTVRHRADAAPILVRRNVTLATPGLPDEVAGQSLDARPVFFQVPTGLARFAAELTWTNGAVGYDLDMEMLDPNGAEVSGGQGATGARPERISIAAPQAGAWTARILPFLSGPTTATLTVQGFPQGSLPRIALGGPYVFGSTDPQALGASVVGGTGASSVAWDLDGDGAFETPGPQVVASLPVGLHEVSARATDAAGFEASARVAVDVRAADTVLKLRCGNDPTTPLWAMEFTSSGGTCWVHGGHHTYFTGARELAFRRAQGWVFTVEQQLSPPSEHNVEPLGSTPLAVEVSADGRTWTQVGSGAYSFASLSQRQRVDLDVPGTGEMFRFLRVREPLSAAQGLAGYLDHSEIDVEADVVRVIGPAPLAPGSRALTCETDILEDFFAAHPCWFGGIDRYDAPSFWHTYPVGDVARLDRVTGEAVLAPWRLDDWTQNDTASNATIARLVVQTSVDGVSWTDHAKVEGRFGTPLVFDVPLAGEDARFVRLFPDLHARFDQTAEFAPNHHPRAYFLHSALVVHGALPT